MCYCALRTFARNLIPGRYFTFSFCSLIMAESFLPSTSSSYTHIRTYLFSSLIIAKFPSVYLLLVLPHRTSKKTHLFLGKKAFFFKFPPVYLVLYKHKRTSVSRCSSRAQFLPIILAIAEPQLPDPIIATFLGALRIYTCVCVCVLLVRL